MKKILPAFFLLAAAGNSLYADDTAIFSELNSAYKSGAFPSAIEYSVVLEKEYPRSVLAGRSLAIRGECLYRLGRYDEAVSVFNEAQPLVKNEKEVLLSCCYYRGKALTALSKSIPALRSFYDAMSFRSTEPSSKENRFYYLSETAAASVFYGSGEYAEAVPLLEDAVANAAFFNSQEHDSNLLQLFDSYLKTENPDRLLEVYGKLKPESVSSVTYSNLRLDAGEAFEKKGQWRKAYDQYVYVLEKGDSLYASLALQKAYNVAALHKKEVGEEPGHILENAKDNLREYDFLLAEFWTRLAVDSFNEKDYKKSEAYFSNARQADSDNSYALLHGVYLSRMQEKEAAAILKKYGDLAEPKEDRPFYLEWLCECAAVSAKENRFDECRSYCEQAVELLKNDSSKKSLYNKTLYYYALSLMRNGEADVAWELYKNVQPADKDEQVLRARLLCEKKRWNEAAALYEKNADTLTDDERADYSKVLFYQGAVNASLRQAGRVNTPDGLYMTALTSFNKKDWKNADYYFRKYIDSKGASKKDYALFYAGYAQYKMGQSLTAFATLSSFVKKYPKHPLTWNASMTCASSAAQNSNLGAAGEYASMAVVSSRTEEEKHSSILLCADILSDSGKSDEAVAVLAASARENSDFGILARYQTALIYSKNERLAESDRMFEEIQNKFSSNALADEASYRRGELYYTHGMYPQAVSRFNEYHRKFSSGRFKDAAYYYMADSYAAMEQYDRAKVQYTTLLQAYPESSYAYNARKNLTEVYRKSGDYDKALALAQETIAAFPKESREDSFSEQIKELRSLAGGLSPEYIRLSREYSEAGSSTTAEGRKKGTELCEFMIRDMSLKQDALILAHELYSVQSKKKDEAAWACRTGIIHAQDLREQNKNESAASVFLECAAFAAGSSDSKVQQRALYGAAESFLSAGKYGDAREVSDKLHELYPGSEYDIKCRSLFD